MKQVIYGKKALLDHINDEIINVDILSTHYEIVKILKDKKISYQLRNANFFNNLPATLHHQGVITTLKQTKKYESLDELINDKSKQTSVVLVVDSLQDSQNFGAIIRTCDALGVDAVIYKKDNQVQINDFVIKSSVGAVNHVPLFRVSNLTQALTLLKKNGYWTYVSTLGEDAKNYTDIKYDKKTVIVVGNEDHGVSKIIIDNADFKVKIKMVGKVQSLNVSVATAILLSEITRQK